MDDNICQQWAIVQMECRNKGRRIEGNDAWIAATALHYDIPLVTHNAKDFRCIDALEIITYSDN